MLLDKALCPINPYSICREVVPKSTPAYAIHTLFEPAMIKRKSTRCKLKSIADHNFLLLFQ
jgi:hypothetical protein